MPLGLLRRLFHVAADALDEGAVCAGGIAGGPGADQRLVQEILVVAVRRDATVHLTLEAAADHPPAADVRGPCRGHLREHADAGAHVLATLGVVGGRADERVGPPLQSPRVFLMKGGHGFAVAGGLATHLVERHEPVVDVERRVLHALGGDGARRLLETHRESPA